MTLISVIVPVYNVEKYIERCLESIINQTYSYLEIILVDDGSLDSSGEICEEYARNDKRFKVYHKENGGLSDARNYGIARAKGEYITCIDSDDYVDTDYIEYLIGLIQKYNTKMSICQHRVYYNSGKIKDIGSVRDEALINKVCIERMLYHDIIDTSAWAKLYHKSLFEKVLYPKGKLFEDIGTTYALMLQCEQIAVGYEAKYNYIFHNNSIVNGSFNIKKMDLLEMTDKMASEITEIYGDIKCAVLRRQVYSRLSTLNQMLETNKYETEKKNIIDFVNNNRNAVLKDRKAPKRDKIAIFLIGINYSLYKFAWLTYRKRIMN